MLRAAILTACLVALAGCGEGDEDAGGGGATAPPPATELTVTVWPQGRDGPERTQAVECPGDDVCGRLSVGKFAPVPRTTPCTAIYGGPAVARVTGTLRGERVDAEFSLEDGCEIARWERNRALLGPPRQ
jgi:hypothetical protein